MRNLTIIIIALLFTTSAYGFWGKKKSFYILDRQVTQKAASNGEIFGQLIYDRYIDGGRNLTIESIGQWNNSGQISILTTDIANKTYYVAYQLRISSLTVLFCTTDLVNPFDPNARHGFAIENGDYEDLCAAIKGQFQATKTSSNSLTNGLGMNLLGNSANEVRTSVRASHSAQMTPVSYSPAAERTEVSQSRGSKVMNFMDSFFSVFRGVKRNESPASSTRLPLFVSL